MILRKALRVAEEIYGLKKGPTISIIFRLATIIMSQGRQDDKDNTERNLEMLMLFKRVMIAWKVTPSYGPVHPETLKIIHLISGIYYEQGKSIFLSCAFLSIDSKSTSVLCIFSHICCFSMIRA